MNRGIRYITPEILEINWPAAISEEILFDMLKVKASVHKKLGDRIKAVRVGYHILSLHLDSVADCMDEIRQSLEVSDNDETSYTPTYWRLPVCYEPELAKDLVRFLQTKGMKLDEFVALHSGVDYLLHFYGFLPGFMYLGGLPEVLAMPRKQFPDRRIEQGAVAIGGYQTGVYPVSSPGGWHVVGSTPIRIFNASSGKLPPFSPGDRIRFVPIQRDAYEQILAGTLDWDYA
ncbi:Allophanate hydrolase 2 subunit 1 [Lunatimonas lonarensis]|uniref:Allophanate hydrolase 2 subunit 1 n=1 Tax=Lunatimonas lonarensis TaxID=1232681 RepID=R7ZQW5_9BACT|nr:carboxyltransferase domain-containing protein [Lunatimonas lonarensis]EON76404.1 Allophanate hydrolase 2 subunit 1 [Lunatimonas lonarensis]